MGSTQDTWRRISQIQNRHNTLKWRDLHFVFFSPVGDFFRWYWGGIGGKDRNSGDILRSWVCLRGCYSPFGLNELKGFEVFPLNRFAYYKKYGAKELVFQLLKFLFYGVVRITYNNYYNNQLLGIKVAINRGIIKYKVAKDIKF